MSVFLLAEVEAWNVVEEGGFDDDDDAEDVDGGFWIRPVLLEPGGGGNKIPPAAPPELGFGLEIELSVFFFIKNNDNQTIDN